MKIRARPEKVSEDRLGHSPTFGSITNIRQQSQEACPLDGIFHRAAPTVIDRESVREGVLDGLGWKTMRVSAIDALRNLDDTAARIDTAARESR